MPSGTVWQGGRAADSGEASGRSGAVGGGRHYCSSVREGLENRRLRRVLLTRTMPALDEIVCLADPADIRRWLFYARTPQGDGDPGF